MKKVRFAIIGTNQITDQFIEAGQQDEHFKLCAIYSRTEEKGKAFGAKYGIDVIFTSLEALAQSNVVDAVYIASPNVCHAKQAIYLMSQGLHVICEKPLASNLKEVEAMIEAAKTHGVTFMEAMIPTTLPNYHVVKEHLHKIGRIRHYYGTLCKYSSRYDAYKAGEVLNAFKPELSNGALVDIGVYTIAPMIGLFGAPQALKASGYVLESGVDGSGSITFDYQGMLATVMYSKITTSSLGAEIQGENGSLYIDMIQRPKHVSIKYRDGREEVLSVAQSDVIMSYEITEFIEAILTGQQETVSNTWEMSLQTMAVLDEARRQIGLVYSADRNE